MVAAIVTFASSSFAHAHRRFEKQARAFDLFDEYFIFTESDLDPEFRLEFRHVLHENVRGYGYWVWKPQIILQAMRRLEDGDELVYVDSGSHLIPGAKNRMEDYLNLARTSQAGIVAFQLDMPEKNWCKADLLDYFGGLENPEMSDSGQVQGGAIIMVRNQSTINFLERWLNIVHLRPDLVDDSPSNIPNFGGFREHRHDQAVFSLLSKQAGVALLPAWEQYPNPGKTWEDLSGYPIHHRRDTVQQTVLVRVKKALRRVFLPVESWLVRKKAQLIEVFSGD
jgi:hypothetical protein